MLVALPSNCSLPRVTALHFWSDIIVQTSQIVENVIEQRVSVAKEKGQGGGGEGHLPRLAEHSPPPLEIFEIMYTAV